MKKKMRIESVTSEELGRQAYERVAPHIFVAIDRDNCESRVLFTEDGGENATLVRKPWGFDIEEAINGLL